MRILLDTNLLVRAAITPKGSAREILRLIEASAEHTLVISTYLLSEVADVLRRDRIRARWPLTDLEIGAYCQYLARVAEEVTPEALPAVIHDEKDQAVVETAVSGRVDAICTSDGHFYQAPVLEFCEAHAIRVLKDVELLNRLRRAI